MKKEIFFKLIKKMRERPDLKRKLKIFILIGITGIFLMVSLAIWAGISAFNFFAVKADQALSSTVTQGHIQNIKTEVQKVPQFQALNCWVKAESLFAVHPWLVRPAIENMISLKEACFQQQNLTKPIEDSDLHF